MSIIARNAGPAHMQRRLQRAQRKRFFALLSGLRMQRHNGSIAHQGKAPRALLCRGMARRPTSQGEPCICRDQDAAKELLQFKRLVIEILPDSRYRVEVDNGDALVAYMAGKMKKNRINPSTDDRVIVEVSSHDPQKGRLIFRHKGDLDGFGDGSAQRSHLRRR